MYCRFSGKGTVLIKIRNLVQHLEKGTGGKTDGILQHTSVSCEGFK
jgi:hypothetical protein